MSISLTHIRFIFSTLLLLSVLLGVVGHTTGTTAGVPSYDKQFQRSFEDRPQTVRPRDNITVVSGDAFKREEGQLVAFAPDGRVLYYNDTYSGYLDIEPVPEAESTVIYVAETSIADTSACQSPVDSCSKSVIERVNLTTGKVERVYSWIIPQDDQANWFDADVLGSNRILIGDVYNDRVYIINTETGIVSWGWQVQSEFSIHKGGTFPTDWVYINDVEIAGEEKVMASLRNLDRVVFIDVTNGYQETWTIGPEQGIREPYDPDYIPEERGGPAVLIADSQNSRIVEFARSGDEWEQTWTWQDQQLNLPRDADRLPNGNTLIADSHGHRIIEVNRNGTVVWTAPYWKPKDVERLGTGDGSTRGQSAESLNLTSKIANSSEDAKSRGPVQTLVREIVRLLPYETITVLLGLFPRWMSVLSIVASAVFISVSISWATVEGLWRLEVIGDGDA